MTSFWCEQAWLGGDHATPSVRVETKGGIITRIQRDLPAIRSDQILKGLVIPGLANAHSHAFHRALRGNTLEVDGSFGSWRQKMYRVAQKLNPDNYYQLAAAVFSEMALSGITTVGEFHYLHHQPDGKPYDDPNEMSGAIISAAAAARIRLTLLDVCYLQGGVNADPLSAEQLRFSDGDASSWARRVAQLPADTDLVTHGSAIHSVRAVSKQAMTAVAQRPGPLHAHVSEQISENQQCLAATGLTPTELLDAAGVIDSSFSAVHATHLSPNDLSILANAQATAIFCPTTERDLADGIGPARELHNLGTPIAVGSDSNAVIDLIEEVRAVELNERLISNRRGTFTPRQLWSMATVNGHKALGWSNAGQISVGGFADLVAINTRSVRTAGTGSTCMLGIVFSATSADVTEVIVGAKTVVQGSQHVAIDVPAALTSAIANLNLEGTSPNA